MVNPGSRGGAVGRITKGLRPGTLVDKTIAFVHRQLAPWRDDPDRTDEKSENRLNLQLCKFLDSRARQEFPMVRFDTEEPQTGQRRVDLSASPAETILVGPRQYTIYTPILVLEGKRLPAPSADREMEYVTGVAHKNGGIQRFKLGLHGAQLQVAAMVAYIQDRGTSYWHRTVNKWISDLAAGSLGDICSWHISEMLGQLEKQPAGRVAMCQSVHARHGKTASDSIHLHHLWVEMNRGRTAALSHFGGMSQ